MARFSGVPPVPLTLEDEQLTRILYALKENVELLTGQRGEPDGASEALTSGSLTVEPASNIYQGVTARAVGVKIQSVSVPILEDYVKLLQDLQSLAYDVAILRDTVNTLIIQLRSNT